MEAVAARYAQVVVSIGGVDISGDIAGSMESFTYTDQAHGKSDDVSLTLQDRDDLWKSGWMPDKGTEFTAKIKCCNWDGPGQNLTLPCGRYEIDDISIDGPPDKVTIKGVSAKISSTARSEKRSKAWENTTLQAVAAEIAGESQLALYYDGPSVSFKRIERRQASALEWLRQLCEKFGCNLKVGDYMMIVYSGKSGDAQAPGATFTRGQSDIIRHRLHDKGAKTYKACEVRYWDTVKKKELKFKHQSPTSFVGQTLTINKRVENLGQARQVAECELRKANKHEKEVTLDLMGRPDIDAGTTVSLSGYGKFDGNYFVEQASHRVDSGGGYATSLKLRWALEY